MPTALLLAALSLPMLAAQAPPNETAPPVTGFLDKTISVDGEEHRYVVYVPPGYRADRRWPMLVFLNGKGECGTDGKRHVEVGLGPAIQKAPERWPFVVVFPQKPESETWWTAHEALVLATADATEREFSIDPARRFLTGLSQGGHGTWAIGAAHPDRWAALAPVCGFRIGSLPVENLAGKPVWAFHGLDDRVVPAQQSQLLCEALRKAGGDPILTTYEGVGHNSWDRAYGESCLAEWFRTVVDDPLGARCLATPLAGGAARLEVARRTTRGDSIREAFGAVEVDGGLVSTKWRDAEQAAGAEGATRVGHWRDVPREELDRLVRAPLRALWRGGAFDAGRAERSPAKDAPGIAVVVTLRGAQGPWRRQVWLGEDEADADVAREAAAALLELIAEKR